VIGAHLRRQRTERQARGLLREEPVESAPEPLAVMVREEEVVAVRAALDGLHLKHRTVLVLFELEQWSCSDIAEALAIPVDTVYSRLHHARRKLASKVSSRFGRRA